MFQCKSMPRPLLLLYLSYMQNDDFSFKPVVGNGNGKCVNGTTVLFKDNSVLKCGLSEKKYADLLYILQVYQRKAILSCPKTAIQCQHSQTEHVQFG